MFLKFAALSGFLAVALGAFGAHGLKARLNDDMMVVYHTAVEYHFIHTLALLVVVLLDLKFTQVALFNVSAWAFAVGIVIFSGSLYVLSLTGIKVLGAVTPLGGLAFLIGWLCLFLAAFKLS